MSSDAQWRLPVGLRHFLAGAMAATSAGFFSNPMEVVKIRLQLSGELGRVASRQYSGPINGVSPHPRFLSYPLLSFPLLFFPHLPSVFFLL